MGSGCLVWMLGVRCCGWGWGRVRVAAWRQRTVVEGAAVHRDEARVARLVKPHGRHGHAWLGLGSGLGLGMGLGKGGTGTPARDTVRERVGAQLSRWVQVRVRVRVHGGWCAVAPESRQGSQGKAHPCMVGAALGAELLREMQGDIGRCREM